jgi:site-specific DNA-methyltransferase (cytosine-N4-specific)
MPESVTDRPTKAHEYVFMLAKSEKYYYDAAAVAEPAVGCNNHDLTGQGYSAPGQTKQTGNRKPRTAGNKSHKYVTEYEASATEEHRTKAGLMKVADKPWYTRNRRTVWTVATKPFPGVHFATFPPKLIEPCILAGCPVDGLVLDPFCGSGTTGMVAVQHGRRFVGCDINADYCRMAEERIQSGK